MLAKTFQMMYGYGFLLNNPGTTSHCTVKIILERLRAKHPSNKNTVISKNNAPIDQDSFST